MGEAPGPGSHPARGAGSVLPGQVSLLHLGTFAIGQESECPAEDAMSGPQRRKTGMEEGEAWR
jgi:hypothetical protein